LVHIFDTETLAERQTFRAHDGPITALAWHPTRHILATGSDDLTIKLWNLETGRRLDTLRGPTGTPRVLNFSPSGQRLACASPSDNTRIWEPESLNEKPVPTQPTDRAWEDLLARLTPAEVEKTGRGWSLKDGELFSPDTADHATLPLPGEVSGISYQVRVRLRQLAGKKFFHLILPVADRMTGFDLDGFPRDGFYTGLVRVNGKAGKDLPGAVYGEQVKDTDPHDLEVTVRLDGANATITATLDGKPLYEWTGPTAALSQDKYFATTEPGALAFGTYAGGWAVSGVKVRREKVEQK
jgi:WD domain, G-beta repeat